MNLKEIVKTKKIKKPPQIKGVKESRALEIQYLKLLKQLTKELKQDVRENIIPLLKDAKITHDSVSDILSALEKLSIKYSNINSFAGHVSEIIVSQAEQHNRKKFLNNINSTIGIDFEGMLKEEGLTDLVALQKNKNKALIKSIPEEFLKDVEVVVQNGITNGLRHEEIAKQLSGIKGIKSVFGKLDNRVKMIARNEISSINGTLNKARQESLGISMYIFETSRDERVRPSHQKMQGKICRWDNPTVYKDSLEDKKWKKRSSIGGVEKHPAIDFNCRCTSIAVIEE